MSYDVQIPNEPIRRFPVESDATYYALCRITAQLGAIRPNVWFIDIDPLFFNVRTLKGDRQHIARIRDRGTLACVVHNGQRTGPTWDELTEYLIEHGPPGQTS